MSSRRNGWSGMGPGRSTARVMFVAGCALGVLLWVNAAPCGLLADAPPQQSPEAQQAPGQTGPASEPGTREEAERSGKPERRQRIRDQGAEDELQARSRRLLAMEIRRAGASA